MKRLISLLTLAMMILAGGAVLLAGCKKSGEKTLYTCGMHPQVIQDHPGNCPICGMKLTPLRKDNAGASNDTSIAVDPVTTQNMGIRTATVLRGPLRKNLRLVGTIDYNEMTL